MEWCKQLGNATLCIIWFITTISSQAMIKPAYTKEQIQMIMTKMGRGMILTPEEIRIAITTVLPAAEENIRNKTLSFQRLNDFKKILHIAIKARPKDILSLDAFSYFFKIQELLQLTEQELTTKMDAINPIFHSACKFMLPFALIIPCIVTTLLLFSRINYERP